MSKLRLALLLLVVIGPLTAGCRKSDESTAAPASAGDQTATAEAAKPSPVPSSPRVGEVSPAEKVAAAVGLADGLPDLKPIIDKPFPEGATEEQVCEAIENTQEKDLWRRFGHILPMYIYGSIFVLVAQEKDTKAILEVTRYGQFKSCKNGKTLFYARKMASVTPPGSSFLGRVPMVEQFSKRLGIKTLESYTICEGQEQSDACYKRLADYCRSDADLCEKLVKLDYANEGEGLCSRAPLRCSLDPFDPAWEKMVARCKKIGGKHFACIEYQKTSAEQSECRETVRKLLCP